MYSFCLSSPDIETLSNIVSQTVQKVKTGVIDMATIKDGDDTASGSGSAAKKQMTVYKPIQAQLPPSQKSIHDLFKPVAKTADGEDQSKKHEADRNQTLLNMFSKA